MANNIPASIPASFLKNIKVSTFSGYPKEDVDDWIEEITEYFDLLHVHPAEQVQAARLLLKHNARHWVRHYQPPLEPDEHWNHFTQALKNRFGSPNSKLFARSKIYQLKQTGSVTSYIQAFENLQAKIDDFGEAEAMQVFIQGLKPKLQEHFAGNPSLRDELPRVMQIAESLDNVQYKHRSVAFTAKTLHQANQDHGPWPMDLSTMSSQSSAPAKGCFNPSQRKQDDYKRGACFYCHETGHQAKECPKKMNQPKLGKAQSQ